MKRLVLVASIAFLLPTSAECGFSSYFARGAFNASWMRNLMKFSVAMDATDIAFRTHNQFKGAPDEDSGEFSEDVRSRIDSVAKRFGVGIDCVRAFDADLAASSSRVSGTTLFLHPTFPQYPPEQQEAILGHEMVHISQQHPSKRVTLFAVSTALSAGLLYKGRTAPLVVGGFFLPKYLYAQCVRAHEEYADLTSARTLKSAQALADALSGPKEESEGTAMAYGDTQARLTNTSYRSSGAMREDLLLSIESAAMAIFLTSKVSRLRNRGIFTALLFFPCLIMHERATRKHPSIPKRVAYLAELAKEQES